MLTCGYLNRSLMLTVHYHAIKHVLWQTIEVNNKWLIVMRLLARLSNQLLFILFLVLLFPLADLPAWCEECFSSQSSSEGYVYASAPGLSRSAISGSCISPSTILIWPKTGSQSLVLAVHSACSSHGIQTQSYWFLSLHLSSGYRYNISTPIHWRS